MFKNGVEATTGIMVYQDVVQQKEVQQMKKYNGEQSSLPLGEPILQHVGEVLRQCEGANLVPGGWVGGDAWFGSIPACVELKKKLNVFSTFILKQHIQYCPKQVLSRVLLARAPKYPAGHHAVMKATISGVDLFIMAYAFSNRDITYMVSSSGTTVSHEHPYRSNFTDEYGNVTFKEIPRPCVAHFLYELLPLIDNHNKDRQSLLALEDCWPTKNAWFRLVTTLIGMAVVDCHRWDRNRRAGGRPLLDMADPEHDPSFISVRAFANLIAKGLRTEEMRYRMKNRFSHPLRGPALMNNTGSALIRITNMEGERSRMSGKRSRDYQQTCFICRQYKKDGEKTTWWCKFCRMPLCKIDRGRGGSCEMAHIGAVGSSIFACQGPGVPRKFVLPNEYKQYLKSPESHDECDDKNDDDASSFTMTGYPVRPNGNLWGSSSEESEDESGDDGGNDSGNKTPINNDAATKRVVVQREPIQTRNAATKRVVVQREPIQTRKKGARNSKTTTGNQQQQRRKQRTWQAKKKKV
jgi:hypothetical protein